MGLFHHILVYMGEGRPTFGPSCNEFVYPDDVLLNHWGLPHVLPLAVHLHCSKYYGLEFLTGSQKVHLSNMRNSKTFEPSLCNIFV